jgi:hypothetical protein
MEYNTAVTLNLLCLLGIIAMGVVLTVAVWL